MKHKIILLILVVAVTATVTRTVLSGVRGKPAITEAKSAPHVSIVAARGRVEPVSEEIEVTAEIGGKLRAVLVKEGDRVRAGQVIAEIENHEYRARVAAAEAELQEKNAMLRRVVNGARPQERLEAQADVAETRAVMEKHRAEAGRRQVLLEKGPYPAKRPNARLKRTTPRRRTMRQLSSTPNWSTRMPARKTAPKRKPT